MNSNEMYANPLVKRLIEANSNLIAAFPHLAKIILSEDMTFRGMTMFIGDTAEMVIGLRIFSDDGTPMILWSSGNSSLEALLNIDRAASTGKFKVDEKALKATT